MKLRVEVDGREYTLDLQLQNGSFRYTLNGTDSACGSASLAQVSPGVYSVLLEDQSFTVRMVPDGGAFEVWTAGERRVISVADARNGYARQKKGAAAGPLEVRAQMPGKVIKVLASKGTAVQAGQGLIVVEAMKMQNEMKSPKAGTVSKVNVAEGENVNAGQALIVVE